MTGTATGTPASSLDADRSQDEGRAYPHCARFWQVNARYGTEPGVKAYSHVSDRFSPFATQTIPATVHEAPYILDGLLMNETRRRVREQYADTGGFTDHVFAACSILGYTFVPRIRDLPSKRLYVFERAGVPKQLRPLVGGKVNADLIDRNWVDILRVATPMAAGTMRPSQILRKLAAYPRQNELAAALREVGRIERSLFMIDWTTDPGMRRRAQVGLNKGEAHALKRAINFHQRGELRDRTEERQHYRLGWEPHSPPARLAHFGATMFVCERASLGRPDAAVPGPVRAPWLATSGGQAGRRGPRHRCSGAA